LRKTRIERRIITGLADTQGVSILAVRALLRIFQRPYYYREFITHLDKIGVGSIFIISLTGLFTGMVMALQAIIQLKPFAATSYVGGMVAVTMVKELGPVLSSLMVTGRCCSAITAELGTMVVTEQVDAMRVEGTDIITRLVTPRLKATLLAMPLLALITDAISVVGGYIIAAGYGISPLMYWKSLPQFMRPLDLFEAVAKPAVFGFILCMTGCYVGLNTRGGAEGVGEGAKKAVVIASVLILVIDFFMTKVLVVFR
jgi:phospholipid/cholesterol/gamma-HCH transport system permease protein